MNRLFAPKFVLLTVLTLLALTVMPQVGWCTIIEDGKEPPFDLIGAIVGVIRALFG